MQFQNYHTSFYSLLAAAAQLTHSRAASGFNAVLVTFAKTDTANSAKKVQNDLFLPPTQALKPRLTIGERRFPATEDPQGLSLFYWRLMQSMGDRPPNISREAFGANSFIAAFDLESAPKVQHSGVSTNNAPLNLFLEGIYSAAEEQGNKPGAVFLHIAHDTLLEITKRGIIVGV